MSHASRHPSPGNGSPFNRSVQHDTKRAAILSQAAVLFNSQGARATTLTQIAEGLGLTKTSLYNYVKTKEELIYQCYMAALEHYHDTLDRIEAEQGSAVDRISWFYLQQYEDWLAARDGRGYYSAALLEIAALKGSHRSDVESLYLSMFKRIRGYLRDGIADGSVRDCDTISAARGLLGAIPWTFGWLRGLSDEEVRDAAQAALDILHHGFAAGSAHYEFAESLEPLADDTLLAQGQRPGQLKKELFYRAASWHFNRKGFNGASLDEIAERVEASKGAFYYHISNKEGLLLNCHLYSLDMIDAIQGEAGSLASNGAEKLEYVCRRLFVVQNSEQGPLIRHRTLTALPQRQRRQVIKRRRASNQRFGEFLRAGVADGSVRQLDLTVAENLLGGILNAAMDMQAWRQIDNLELAAIDYLDLFFNGLLPRQPQ